MATELHRCRICESSNLTPILSLGDMPAVNSFLTTDANFDSERRYPLAIALCAPCAHLQLTHMLDPKDIFTDYVYFSSMSETIVRWGETLAQRYRTELSLSRADLVCEIASNDGCILRPFRGLSRIIGVEPATNIAEVANREGVPTRNVFFNSSTAKQLLSELGPANLIIARNVLAHVPDLVDFVAGVQSWLDPDGIFHVEVPYVRPMLDHVEFDTIYHEHLSYFSVTALDVLFKRAGLVLWDVEEIPLHGGSLIARGRRGGTPTPNVRSYLAQELDAGLKLARPYEAFAERTKVLRTSIPALLRKLHSEGSTIAAYGAAAKGVVLTNYCGLGTDLIRFVADRSPYKQNKLMPGTHLPVVPPEEVFSQKPGFLLVLAWNFFDEIRRQLASYELAGGRFILPVPSPRVVS